MSKIPVIAIFDIGKITKKLFLFDEHYKIVFKKYVEHAEIIDEQGEPCENLDSLEIFVFDSIIEVMRDGRFKIQAINFTSYGATLVYLDNKGEPLGTSYSYLKSYPESLKKQLCSKYGGEEKLSHETSSPIQGSLNAGLQIFRIKKEKPYLFKQIHHALHLPQYLSFLFSRMTYSEITNIGCHTALWHFEKNKYHEWVEKEEIMEKLPPIFPSEEAVSSLVHWNFNIGIGLQSCSAALIPYLATFDEQPFILINTGTWCVTLNPFDDTPLTSEELQNNCLFYYTYEGKQVKASRLFAGYEHNHQMKRIAKHFNQPVSKYSSIKFDPLTFSRLENNNPYHGSLLSKEYFNLKDSGFASRNLNNFSTDEEAYHQLMLDIVKQQFISTTYVLKGTEVRRIIVDGGFSTNEIYMNLLHMYFPDLEIFASSVQHSSALGAALVIHDYWNSQTFPTDFINLKCYSTSYILSEKVEDYVFQVPDYSDL